MTFKDEFPSLKNDLLDAKDLDLWVIDADKVMENCLDKQRIKDAIEKIPNKDCQEWLMKTLLLEKLSRY